MGFVGGWSAYFWKTREQRAEFEDWKRKRDETKAAHTEHLERMDKLADILVKLKQHEVPADQLEEAMERLATPLDDGQEFLPLDRSPQEVYELIEHQARLQAYWGLLDAKNRCKREGVELPQALSKAFEEHASRLKPEVANATAAERQRATDILLLLLWLTGIEVTFFDDGDPISWQSLVGEIEQRK